MKVVALRAVGDLALEERELPVPKSGEVRVKVMASGVCGSDIPRIWRTGTPSFPRVIGHEFSGRIDAVGSGGDEALIGRRVAVFPIKPCHDCVFCRHHYYARCLNYSSYGSRCDGGFSEYLTVPLFNLVFFADDVSYPQAAMLEPATIALHVVRRAALDLNDTVAIIGAGPIGLLTARWAQLHGAGKIVLLDIDPDKIAFCKQLGFEYALRCDEAGALDSLRQLTDGGAHVVIEGSGSAPGLCFALDACRTFGSVMLLGNCHEEMVIPRLAYDLAMRKELTLAGVYNSVYKGYPHDEWADAARAISSGALLVSDLISHQVGIGQAIDLLNAIHQRQQFTCKCMVTAEE
ncbi:galactitol-1-phosphate 5-dehydrogenase [Klebsiella sp. WOUb02]|uniref:galactitol-1-phosphate 5-dehydrogenase n=1 Tax=Klebsiella sp. WOUb02 TaxID=3161071 RepID=UPI003CEE735F